MKFTDGVKLLSKAPEITSAEAEFKFKPGIFTVAVIPVSKLQSFNTILQRAKKVKLLGKPYRTNKGWLVILYRPRTVTNVDWFLKVLESYADIMDMNVKSIGELKRSIREAESEITTVIRRKAVEILTDLTTEKKEEDEEERES